MMRRHCHVCLVCCDVWPSRGSTPSKPVHCIVWAKQLFCLMFGKTEESMLYEDPVTGKSAFMDQVKCSNIHMSTSMCAPPSHLFHPNLQ